MRFSFVCLKNEMLLRSAPTQLMLMMLGAVCLLSGMWLVGWGGVGWEPVQADKDRMFPNCNTT